MGTVDKEDCCACQHGTYGCMCENHKFCEQCKSTTNLFVPKGWECPKCGLVNSPLLSFCPCSKMSITVSASSASGEEELDTINVSEWVTRRTYSPEPSNGLDGEKESEK